MDPGTSGRRRQRAGGIAMLRRSMPMFRHGLHPFLPTACSMTSLFLALVPLLFATGSLVWLFSSGAAAQARSDAFAEQWMRDNA
jgi:hypothetical protein